jgi:hypothetical protein
VPVLLLVLACASVLPRNEPLRFVGDSSLARHESFRWIKAAESWLENQSLKHPTLEVFQVHCLLILASRGVAFKVKRAWSQAGHSLRTAMAAGMHCDPAHLDKSMSFSDQEMRRRIWATLVELELQTSIDRGMPATLQPNSFTCPPPTNVDDYDFRNNLTPEPVDLTVQTPASFLIASRNSFVTRSEVVSVLNDLSRGFSYHDILNLDRQINQELDNFPSYSHTGKSAPLGTESMAGLGKSLHQLQLLQLLLLMHTSFATRIYEDARYKYSQTACLEAAERVFSIYNEADEDRRTVLSLLRSDLSRTCVSVCHIILSSSTNCSKSASSHDTHTSFHNHTTQHD